MRILKNILWAIVALGIIAIIYTSISLYLTDWTSYRILFNYQTPVLRILSAITISLFSLLFVFRIKFKRSEIEILNNKIVTFLIKIGFSAIIIFFFYSFFDYGMRTVLYKTAKEKVVYQTEVKSMNCFYRGSSLQLTRIDNNEEILIEWSGTSLRDLDENAKDNEAISLLKDCYSIKKGDLVILTGRKNMFGLAIDKLEKKDDL